MVKNLNRYGFAHMQDLRKGLREDLLARACGVCAICAAGAGHGNAHGRLQAEHSRRAGGAARVTQ